MTAEEKSEQDDVEATESGKPDIEPLPPTPFEDEESGNWWIECDKCGALDDIPFEPYDDAVVYCRECFERDKRERQERERSSPRKKHGTRVSFSIVCSECGKDEELDYVPSGVPMDEMLCTECFEEESDAGRWKQVRKQKEREQLSEWSFRCSECGRTDWLNFEPNPRKDYKCTRCFYEQAEPKKERTQNKESVGLGVYIRKSDKDDE